MILLTIVIQPLIELFLTTQLFILHYSLELLRSQAKKYIFRLEISMNNPTDSIQEI